MSTEIPVPQPAHPIMERVDIATEVAFGALIKTATIEQLAPDPTMGLMYLPDEAVTRQFQVACRAVLTCLNVKGIES
jgi:hypothetical protein